MKEWRSVVPAAASAYDSGAQVTILEFADLECPFCKKFHKELSAVVASSDVKVRSVFIHYPLPQHRFAIPGANAAECARKQGKFKEFIDLAFVKQDSLGLKQWTSYAHDAGVGDTAAFARCNAVRTPSVEVQTGLEAGERIGVKGTPTVIINGWRYNIPPYDSLAAVIKRLAEHPAPTP